MEGNGEADGMPHESVEFLLQETIRQHEDLLASKDSVDTRASFMLGLLGVILTIFAGLFVSFWTSPSAVQLSNTDLFGWWLTLLSTTGVVVALTLALTLEIWILLPKTFAAGVDLFAVYKAASDEANDSDSLKDATASAMIPSVSENLVTYLGNSLLYQIGSILTAIAVVLLAEFLTIVVTSSFASDSISRVPMWIALSLIAVGILIFAGWKSRRIIRVYRKAVEEEKQARADFERFLTTHNP